MITKKTVSTLWLCIASCGTFAQVTTVSPGMPAAQEAKEPAHIRTYRTPASMSAQDAFNDANAILNTERAFHLNETKKSLEHAPAVNSATAKQAASAAPDSPVTPAISARPRKTTP